MAAPGTRLRGLGTCRKRHRWRRLGARSSPSRTSCAPGQSNEPVVIRNSEAVRPWQHVLEPLAGYLALAERSVTDGASFAEAWNFGPSDSDARPVRDL